MLCNMRSKLIPKVLNAFSPKICDIEKIFLLIISKWMERELNLASNLTTWHHTACVTCLMQSSEG